MSRPPFKPTAEQRQLVLNLASIGCTVDEIQHCIPWGRPKPIDGKTLLKHFADELDRGRALDAMRVKKRLHDLIDQGNVAAIIFYLKVRCGYSETVKVEATGRDGTPLAPLAQVTVYLPVKDARPEDALPAEAAPPISSAATPPASQPKAALPPWQEPPRPQAPPTPPEATAAGSVRPSGYMYPGAADPRR